jgi:hypothetical protein
MLFIFKYFGRIFVFLILHPKRYRDPGVCYTEIHEMDGVDNCAERVCGEYVLGVLAVKARKDVEWRD